MSEWTGVSRLYSVCDGMVVSVDYATDGAVRLSILGKGQPQVGTILNETEKQGLMSLLSYVPEVPTHE